MTASELVAVPIFALHHLCRQALGFCTTSFGGAGLSVVHYREGYGLTLAVSDSQFLALWCFCDWAVSSPVVAGRARVSTGGREIP